METSRSSVAGQTGEVQIPGVDAALGAGEFLAQERDVDGEAFGEWIAGNAVSARVLAMTVGHLASDIIRRVAGELYSNKPTTLSNLSGITE